MSRFYAPKENVDITSGKINIDGQEARHIMNVMRLKVGDSVVVFDNTGKEYSGKISETKPKSLTVEIIDTRTPKKETLPYVAIAQAIPKKEKMDYIVEKATELGVSEIIPLLTERTIAEVDDSRVERWRKIAREASKQCGRTDIPKIRDITDYEALFENISDFDIALFASLYDKSAPIKKAIKDRTGGLFLVFVGPEGDFSEKEIHSASKYDNIKFISLGQRVLKSDTAGLYILSCLNYEFA